MRVDELDFELPEDRIASRPAARREDARLLVVGDALRDATIRDWPSLVPRGSLVVVNDTRVLRARLLGHKATSNGRVELLVIETLDTSGAATAGFDAEHPEVRARALARSSKPLRPGTLILFDEAFEAIIEAPAETPGSWVVTLRAKAGTVAQAIERLGHVPLPPYVGRADDDSDVDRYQTVFAKRPGAVAAPTAGLHVSEAILEALAAREIEVASCTLHVGLGTFAPVKVDDLDAHPMHAEWFEVAPSLVASVRRARERGAPVVAVGTTSVRALESAFDPDNVGLVRADSGQTRLLIQPGYTFRVVDGLLTNFHLPRSTLLALVAAKIGLPRLREAYAAAIERGYRFYSYGDAMFIPPPADTSRADAADRRSFDL